MYRNPFTTFSAYLHNRFICPSHRVTIRHPDCPKGHYRDADTILLYAAFTVLQDYVEIELGSHWGPYYFETFGQKVYRIISNLPGLHWYLPHGRNVRRGLHHLRWAMNLKDMPSQAESARHTYQLYRFWTRSRRARVEPFSTGGDRFENERVIRNGRFQLSPEYSAYLDTQSALEEKYHAEDTEMLKLLVEIRRSLWT